MKQTPEQKESIAVEKVVDKLSNIKKQDDDLYDTVAVIVSDIEDIYKAPSHNNFQKQKYDLQRSIKALEKQVRALSYNMMKIEEKNKK
jgi:SHS2 domain-containing protein